MPFSVDHFKQQIYPPIQSAWSTIKTKSEHSKQWISEHGSKVLKTLNTKVYQPMHARYIKPLNKQDVFLLIGVPLLAVAVSVVAFYALGALACTLAVVALSITVPFVMAIPIKKIQAYHSRKAAIQLDALKTELNRTPLNHKKLEEILQTLDKPEFSHIETKELRKKYDHFTESTLSKEKLIAYVTTFSNQLKGILPQPQPKPLPTPPSSPKPSNPNIQKPGNTSSTPVLPSSNPMPVISSPADDTTAPQLDSPNPLPASALIDPPTSPDLNNTIEFTLKKTKD